MRKKARRHGPIAPENPAKAVQEEGPEVSGPGEIVARQEHGPELLGVQLMGPSTLRQTMNGKPLKKAMVSNK
jgi:hypothetical protein